MNPIFSDSLNRNGWKLWSPIAYMTCYCQDFQITLVTSLAQAPKEQATSSHWTQNASAVPSDLSLNDTRDTITPAFFQFNTYHYFIVALKSSSAYILFCSLISVFYYILFMYSKATHKTWSATIALTSN